MLITLGNEIPPKIAPVSAGERINLPYGLLEFPEHKVFNLVCMQQSWPYSILSPVSDETTRFIVIEPAGWIQDYNINLPDREAEWLDIYSPQDALVLNLVKIVSFDPQEVYIHVDSALIINRNNLVGKHLQTNSGAKMFPLTLPSYAV